MATATEIHRTFFCGKPNADQKALFETALQLNESALSQTYAKNRVSKIDEAVQMTAFKCRALQISRASRRSRYRDYDPRIPGDVPFHPRSIQDNEVFSHEPGLYVKDIGGFRIGDIVVAQDKPKILTSMPKTLADCTLD